MAACRINERNVSLLLSFTLPSCYFHDVLTRRNVKAVAINRDLVFRVLRFSLFTNFSLGLFFFPGVMIRLETKTGKIIATTMNRNAVNKETDRLVESLFAWSMRISSVNDIVRLSFIVQLKCYL